MKKAITLIIAVFSLMLAGCGHNVSIYSKGVGFELAWRPNTAMPSLRVGSYENLDLMQKENNQVRYASNSGIGFDWFGLKSLFSGKKGSDIGIGTTLEVKTGPQINGYVAEVMQNKDLNQHHANIIHDITSVEMDLGDKETHLGLGEVSTNTTPVVITEKGILGSSKVTTPANQYTEDAIKKQVNPVGIMDVVKSFGLYIVAGIILIILILAFVIVHMMQKISDLKDMVKNGKEIVDDVKEMVK